MIDKNRDKSSGALRVGIIGCGHVVVNEHAPVLSRLDGVRVVGVVDPVAARRAPVLELLDLPPEAGYASHQALLQSQALDYGLVAVPPAYRSEIVEACANQGVHVLAEKPIATRPADSAAAQRKMAAAGLQFGMVHNYLFYPEYRQLRSLIAAGALGDVRHIGLNFLGVPDKPGASDYRPHWRHDPQEAGGGVLMDMIHAVYLAEYLVGAQVRAVSAVVDNLGYPGDAVENLALVHLYFPEAYATINMGWGFGPGGVEVSGSAGRALVFYRDFGTGPFSDLESFTVINQQGRREYQPRRNYAKYDNFIAIHQDYVHALHEGRTPLAAAEAGQRSLEVALSAYASALQGHVVAIPMAPEDPVFLRGVSGLQELPAWQESPLLRRGLFGLKQDGSNRG